MPPTDQAPRYQLVDPTTGNVVGSVFGDGNGNVVIADETDTQTTFDSDGVTTPALEADTLVGADVQNATDGTVPTSDGAGNLVMEASGGGNVPDWTEDPNSPLEVSNSTSGTITLSNSYDLVLIYPFSTTGGTRNINMRINGDTSGSYDVRKSDGTTTTAANRVNLVFNQNQTNGTVMRMAGRWDFKWGATFDVAWPAQEVPVSAANDNVTSPLDSITFLSNNSFTASFHVFGWSV